MHKCNKIVVSIFVIFCFSCYLTARRVVYASYIFDGIRPVISISSTHSRLHAELPRSIRSLLAQTVKPSRIMVYLPQNNTHIEFPPELKDPLVEVLFVKDIGPMTKFYYTITQFTQSSCNLPIIICDDDHLYSAYTVQALYHAYLRQPLNAYGLRGWRIKDDLTWGVSSKEYKFHVIEGAKIAEPYQVGVLTANYCYIISPTFFSLQSELLDVHNVSNSIRFVDDIWMNGHLAKLNIPRWVIPIQGKHVDITNIHVLEDVMMHNNVSRMLSNNEALQYFGPYWNKNIMYRCCGERSPIYIHKISYMYKACVAKIKYYWYLLV